ncbi:hypothetical protein QTH91_08495 [Variovorax dokdonensis]|uniref:Transmembrane protein n=1 Tax=Variovorax dokdonensis TaxID=344883 RepID=A0ABT7N9G2_9BURK|nr:hypothetical protein [Variovorax dokdonensis]MDM0044515.1 hypothetical protein [Variovorax dokdonensis]
MSDKEEYLALQSELREAARSLHRLEWACGLGALLAFSLVLLSAGGFVAYQGLLWLTPIAFPVYGCVKAWAISSRMRLIGRYLAKLESAAAAQGHEEEQAPRQEHWFAFSARERSTGPRIAAFLMWLLFLFGTVAASMGGYADFRDQCPEQLRDACAAQEQGGDGDSDSAPTRQNAAWVDASPV